MNNGTLTLTIKSCNIDVTFGPTAAGARTAMVSITDDAPNSPQTVVASGIGQDIQIAATPTANTVTAGQAATYSLSISPMSGFSQNLSLTCSGAQAAATCSVLPSSLTFSGNTPASATVTVSTTAHSLVLPENVKPRFWPTANFPAEVALLALMLLAFIQRSMARQQKGSRKLTVAMGALLASIIFMTVSCGGGSAPMNPGTPSGTFNLTVTATSGTFTRSVTLALNVNEQLN